MPRTSSFFFNDAGGSVFAAIKEARDRLNRTANPDQEVTVMDVPQMHLDDMLDMLRAFGDLRFERKEAMKEPLTINVIVRTGSHALAMAAALPVTDAAEAIELIKGRMRT